MTKTPITDKIKNFLTVLEKLSLPNQLDTGIDQSNFTKNWDQAGKDFNKFFGLDAVRKLDNKLELPPDYMTSPKYQDDAKKVRNIIFGSALDKNIDLLRVTEVPNLEETTYLWKPNISVLLEETVTKASANNVFYRVGDSQSIFIRRSRFPKHLYSAEKSVKLSAFLHNYMGRRPIPQMNAAGQLYRYALQHYQEYLNAAVTEIKSVVQDETTSLILEHLQNIPIENLPSIVYDSILLGLTDAANVGIHKDNVNLTAKANRIGPQILTPEITIPNLSAYINAVTQLEASTELPDSLYSLISSKIQQVATADSNYEASLREYLIEAASLSKINIDKQTRSTATTMYAACGQAINQVLTSFGLSVKPSERIPLFFDRLGYDKKRSKEQQEHFDHALANSISPMSLFRIYNANSLPANSDVVLSFEAFTINMNVNKITGSSKTGDYFDQLKVKPTGLPLDVHKHIKHIAKKRTAETGMPEKQAYLEAFLNVKHSADSIPGSQFGRESIQDILNATYIGGDEFREGVLFVGVAPVFFDSVGGKEIYVCTDFIRPAQTNSVGGDSTVYEITNAAGMYFDKSAGTNTWHEVNSPKVVAERTAKIMSEYKFKPLSEVREEILEHLYKPGSGEAELATVCQTTLLTIYKNCANGFWTCDGPLLSDKQELAGYNPWEDHEHGGFRFRFRASSTDQQAKGLGRQKAKAAYTEKK